MGVDNKRIAGLLEYWRSEAFGNEGLAMIAAVLAYEAIDICRYMNKIFAHGEDTNIWRAEAEIAVQDSLAMLQEICTILSIDLHKSHLEGCQRAAQRAKEIVDRRKS